MFLPQKMTVMIDPHHIWNVIYIARSNRVTKYCACHEKWHSKIWRKCAENGWSVTYNGGRFENDPSMIRTRASHLAPARSPRLLSRFGHAFCIENYSISRPGYLSKFQQTLRLPTKVILQRHQMLRLPGKVAFQHQKLTVQHAPATKSANPTSPTELLHDWTCTWLNYYLTKVWRN